MVGLGMILGGMAKGVGDGLVEQAKAKREEALAQLKFERDRQLAGEARDFQAEQNEKTRAYQTAENESQRAYQSNENALNRTADADYREKVLQQNKEKLDWDKESSGTPVTLEDGTTGNLRGATVEPIKDTAGNPVKITTKSKDATPADVATAEWLVSKGVATDMTDAWNKVKQGVKADPSAADVEKMVETAVKTEFDGQFGVKPEDIQASRERNRARIEKNLGASRQDNAPTGEKSEKTGRLEEYKAGSQYPAVTRESIPDLVEGKIYNTPAGDLRYIGPNRWAKP